MATALKDGSDYKVVGTNFVKPDGIDKVTGRAKFGADHNMPAQLYAKILRSPHGHANIKSIDTSKAAALPGVKAIITGDDFPELPREHIQAGEMVVIFQDLSHNVMAKNKALYDGHAIAAVAATSEAIAKKALKLIEVDYEVLPAVVDPVEAMKPDAPILNENIFTQNVEPKPTKPSNVAKRVEFGVGDVDKGFAEADEIIEHEFNTKTVHQGYIEPHACVASMGEDGSAEMWTSTQGMFAVRATTARILGMDMGKLRVTPSEVGGGFGGKNAIYLEPVALRLSEKAGRPVKMVMTRAEVFRATGPTSGGNIRVKLGAKKDGTITAADIELKYQAGAFEGSGVPMGCMACYARYDLANARAVGWDVVVNRPKVAAYRAPGAPMAIYAVEAAIDDMAEKIGMDPVDMRLKNAAREGVTSHYGVTWGPIGFEQTLEATKKHPQYTRKLGPNQGRGVAAGFWFNRGGDTSVAMNVNEDGTLTMTLGTIDIAGSRGSMAMIAAEEFGISPEDVRPVQGDTASIGFNFLTAGSRVTYAAGMAVTNASREIIGELRARAAKIWDIPVEAVVWEDGMARPASSNAGDFDPLPLMAIARQATATGGPIGAKSQINAQGAGPGFGTHIVDVEVDPETGGVEILDYTVLQDVGRAIHPGNVEGQLQGAASQGVGWALNEEYVYGEDGRLQNPGFLDYRMPVASDMPMVNTVMVEVPNPAHPYGLRGVGEVPLTPALAAVANAVKNALGFRINDLPLNPPRILAAIEEYQARKQAAE